MSQLLVRKVPDSLVKRLKRRAAEHGVSVEEEHRRILRQALEERAPDGTDFIHHLLSPEGRVEDDLLLPPLQFLPPHFGDEA